MTQDHLTPDERLAMSRRETVADIIVEACMNRDETDEGFADLDICIEVLGVTDKDFANMLEETRKQYCDEKDLCPVCGEKCDWEDFVLGVHPYGSTTATEYGSRRVCSSCDWKDTI